MTLLKIATWLLLGAAQLTPTGTISGTIKYSANGFAAAEVKVMVIAVPNDGRTGRASTVIVSQTLTDNTGHYQLQEIPNGQYFVAVGLVTSPTFYPGTLMRSDARIIKIASDARNLSGIDISIISNVPAPPASASVRPCCNLEGLILTDDGSPLPPVPLRIVDAGNSLNVAAKDGFFRFFIPKGTVANFSVEGLPGGYSVASMVYGGRNVGLGPMFIDGREPQSLLVRVIQTGATLPSVSVRGKVVNIAHELNITNLSLTLASILSNGPAFSATVAPDNSFVFPNIPIGLYQTGIRDASGTNWRLTTDTNVQGAITDLTIDLRNNPFPETESGMLVYSIFSEKEIQLTGVATEKLTRNSYKTGYFRLAVKDETTGVVTTWAVYVPDEGLTANIVVGDTYTLMGNVASDGTHRIKAKPF